MTKQFRDFESAREFARTLGLKGTKEWQEYCTLNTLPTNSSSRPDYVYKKKGWISWGDFLGTGNVANQKVYAIKPLTFMNNSGICIRELIEYFKIDAEDVIVFHDDLDVEFGKIKAKFGGSSAGHNGIASIDKFIGKNYSRVRIGIGKPKEKVEVGDFVLQNFDEDEKIEIDKISNNINNSISILVKKKLDLFSSTVNNHK